MINQLETIYRLASTYGSGTYNTSNYDGTSAVTVGPVTIPSSGNVTIGSTTLPVTGPAFLGILAAIVIAVAAGLVYWVIQRRRQRLSTSA